MDCVKINPSLDLNGKGPPKFMFDLSNELSVLKTRIRFLEQRKQRLLAGKDHDDSSSAYWTSSGLERIEAELLEVRSGLAQREGDQ